MLLMHNHDDTNVTKPMLSAAIPASRATYCFQTACASLHAAHWRHGRQCGRRRHCQSSQRARLALYSIGSELWLYHRPPFPYSKPYQIRSISGANIRQRGSIGDYPPDTRDLELLPSWMTDWARNQKLMAHVQEYLNPASSSTRIRYTPHFRD
jgi:hypothetical protein